MAFREIDPRKLALLLTRGTHEGELKKFFTESKTQLLLRGAKVQNIPHGREERIRAICHRLSRKTDDVLRTWFQKNISVAAPASLEEVLLYLEANFDEHEPLPEEEAQLVCRSALVYLFDDEPNAALLKLLQRPLGALETELSSSSPAHDERPSELDGDCDTSADVLPTDIIPVLQNYQLAELLASIISGDESGVDNALVPFGKRTRGLVEALIRLRDGDADAAGEQLLLLDANGPEYELVQGALARARHQRAANNAPTGIRVVIPQPLSDDLEGDTYEIIGAYTNESDSGAVFVQPMFLVSGGKLRNLSRENRTRLFPESGSVMTHKPALRRPIKRRELVHWRVSERDGAEGKTRFHMDVELSPLIEVVRVPVPSSDVDEVRDRIRSHALMGQVSGQQVIFVLSDGVAVASPKGIELVRGEAFDQPWQAWVSLETWLIEGHEYCLDLPQGVASHLDLSPIDVAFRRLLKNLDTERGFATSKAQRRELTELLRSHSGGEVAQRAKRIAASIDQITINEEELDMVLALLGSHAEVRRRVDELVARELEERQGDKAGLQAEIAALKKKKTELETEGREIERRNRVRAEAVAFSVRDAFSSAIRDGTATLANAEIFQLLSGEIGRFGRQEAPTSLAHQSNDWIKRGALSASEVTARLSALGINGRQAFVLSMLSEVAERTGAVLILKGSLARQCARALVRQNRDIVAIIDIPMGLTSSDFLRQQLESLADAKGVALLNADLSPFEIYGAELLDTLMDQALSKEANPKLMLMSCLDGDLCLPLPTALRRVSLLVDLDSNWDEAKQLLDEVDSDTVLLLPALGEKISEVISAVEGDVRHHVERALVKAISIDAPDLGSGQI